MRKMSKSRADDEAVSSTNGSPLNDEPPATEDVNDDKEDETDVDADADETKNDHDSDTSYTGKIKKKTKTKKAKMTKKQKSGKSKASEEEYEVEKIMGSKKIKGKLHYLVRWRGFSADSDTWEPEKTVSCADLIAQFKQEKEDSKNKVLKKEKAGRKRKSKEANKSPSKKTKNEWDESKADENAEYEVDRIMEVHHKKDGSREFLIHWKGWSAKFDSWEPESNLNCTDLINKFMEKVTEARKTQGRSLRVAPESTNRFTLQDPISGRRLSKRRGQRQRVRYDNAE